ncbi:MAG: exopolysaccharide biosynthesis polyprenyl glycosylphosphotransferase [Pseudomonadota bacterium]
MNVQVRIDPAELAPQSRLRSARLRPELIPGLVMLIDTFGLIAAAAIAFSVSDVPMSALAQTDVFATGLLSVLALIFVRCSGSYRLEVIRDPISALDLPVFSVVAATLLVLAAAHGLGARAVIDAGFLVLTAVTASLLLTGLRLLLSGCLRRLEAADMVCRRAVILCANPTPRGTVFEFANRSDGLTRIDGAYCVDDFLRTNAVLGLPVLGDLDDLVASGRRGEIDTVILTIPLHRLPELAGTLDRLRELPIEIELLPGTLQGLPEMREIGTIPTGHHVFKIWRRPLSDWGRTGKMALDYVLAATALICLLPALLAIAVAIRLESPGPVLFRQRRLGYNNQPFEIFKFRTMRHLSDRDGATPQARRSDARVTRVGRVLRRISLDELPQLLNVLNGTMSLVGPRPHALDHNEEFGQLVRGYYGRHKVLPGITGWAQVKGLRGGIGSREELEARVAHDVFYAEHWSLAFDLRILISTVAVVLFQRNAY